ncbi:ABC transporter permease [Pelagibacterium sediminicola]|uniref:ABC transporter permease n=1 Tax=Pelagibacterium sediminicola TaxID=2248761 RepID=UPI000E31B228|nr:ABC transporter permease [Pelagibacterium sediminicola]
MNIILNIYRVLLLAVLLAIWEGAASLGLVTEFTMSRPSRIFAWLGGALVDGFFWMNILVTVRETLLGLLIGAVLGILSGFALAQWRGAFRLLEPFIMALYSLPRVALAPLFLVWFGIGEGSKVALAASLVYFVLLLNTYTGIREIDRNLVNAVRTMGASRGFIARRVLLPSSLTFIFAGLRISIGLALIGTIVGEMIAGQYGLGQMIARAGNMFDTAQVFGIIIVLAILAVLASEGMKLLERWVMRWRPTTETH